MWRKGAVVVDVLCRGRVKIDVTLLIVQFQVHAIVNFIVLQGNVVLVDSVPLLENNLLPVRSSLRRYELLQIANGIIWKA